MDRDMVVEVDRDLCVMTGSCALHAPKTFSHDDDGIVVLGDPAVSTSDELAAAEDNCPSGAIRLRSS
jgi:ferredoxin